MCSSFEKGEQLCQVATQTMGILLYIERELVYNMSE